MKRGFNGQKVMKVWDVSNRLYLRSGLVLPPFAAVYFDYFLGYLFILPSNAQNWKGHIASLWPLSA